MSITLRVQDDNGNVANANSYCDENYFIAYFEEAGITLPDDSVEAIKGALVRGKRYIDSRFRYRGEMASQDRSSAFPRYDLVDSSGNLVMGVPREVKNAQCEYGFITLAGTELNPIPVRDPSGRAIIQQSESVGPISESKTFASGASYLPPEYPPADSILKSAGYVVTGGAIIRG